MGGSTTLMWLNMPYIHGVFGVKNSVPDLFSTASVMEGQGR